MHLKTFGSLRGISLSFDKAFPAIRKAGYDGVEYKGVRAVGEPFFKELLEAYNFSFISQIHTYGETVDEHMASFKHLIRVSLPLDPVLINSQSGKDSWGMDEKTEFIGRCLDYEKEVGVPVAHKIHRGRVTYNPWETRDLLLGFDELRLCCDFSQWVCVCDRLLNNETDIIKLSAKRCIHLHSTVGYQQGPQVPDPRATEYAVQLKAHENWWDIIWQTQQNSQVKISTMSPEFAPPGYQHTQPFSPNPVSDIEEISNWMHTRQKERFNQLINSKHHAAIV